jgi:peptide/nickel transport system substrate-binding protein
MEAMARETDAKKRKAMWDKVQVLFYEDVGRVKFGDSFSLEAIRNNVQGWQAKGELPLWNVWLK